MKVKEMKVKVVVVEMENQPFEGGKERGIYQKGGEGILRVSYIHRLTAYKTQKELYFFPNIECAYSIYSLVVQL
jgi:hypothetical protein